MNTIKLNEILELYKKCGINNNTDTKIRTTINQGTLNNKLNYNVDFYNQKHSPVIISSGNTSNEIFN